MIIGPLRDFAASRRRHCSRVMVRYQGIAGDTSPRTSSSDSRVLLLRTIPLPLPYHRPAANIIGSQETSMPYTYRQGARLHPSPQNREEVTLSAELKKGRVPRIFPAAFTNLPQRLHFPRFGRRPEHGPRPGDRRQHDHSSRWKALRHKAELPVLSDYKRSDSEYGVLNPT